MTTEVTADEWVEYDALNTLALPLYRWANRDLYRTADGWEAGVRTQVYSNGTEHGFATETAEYVLECGPMLRRVLFAGVKALQGDPQWEAYTAALAMGDHDVIVSIEREAAPR